MENNNGLRSFLREIAVVAHVRGKFIPQSGSCTRNARRPKRSKFTLVTSRSNPPEYLNSIRLLIGCQCNCRSIVIMQLQTAVLFPDGAGNDRFVPSNRIYNATIKLVGETGTSCNTGKL